MLYNGGSLFNTAGRVQVWPIWRSMGYVTSVTMTHLSLREPALMRLMLSQCHQLGWSGASSYSSGASDGSVRHVSRYYLCAVKWHGIIVHVVASLSRRPSGTGIIWEP